MRVLVTGSTGKLGSALLKQLKDFDYNVKITSRRKPEGFEHFEWVYSDLLTGEGLEEAVNDIEVIIHAATSPLKNSRLIDVSGLEKFLHKIDHIKHFIFPSIVGIEDIPFKYYKLKCEAEELLTNSSIPYTIARATQFHRFVDDLFLSKPFFNRYVIPGKIKLQCVEADEFAHQLIDLISSSPQGRIEDFGGPEILTLTEMAELKIKVNNETNKVLSIPLSGKLYKSFVDGKNTNAAQKVGTTTFEDYLRKKLV